MSNSKTLSLKKYTKKTVEDCYSFYFKFEKDNNSNNNYTHS